MLSNSQHSVDFFPLGFPRVSSTDAMEVDDPPAESAIDISPERSAWQRKVALLFSC